MDLNKKTIADGVSLVSVNVNQFKTNEIAIALALPLKKETAAANALMIQLLSRRSAKYPSLLDINTKLADLYGASLVASVSKNGESQVLKLGLTCIDDKFSLDSESISLAGVELLTSLLFEPRLDDNGNFYADDVESEKRILIEKLEAEENEKRAYVLRQTEKLMFENEPYGINRFGTKEDINSLKADDIKSAWENALKSAKIMITIVGSADIEKASKLVSNALANVDRDYKGLTPTTFVPVANEVKEHMERIDVKQGKLVLGYRVNLEPNDALAPAMRSFCDIFGGGPYSKLFANVREKLSLCYYCSSRYVRQKSFILVQSGCNEENMDKAIKEIQNQLDAIINGDFEDEFNSSKLGLKDTIMSINDTPGAIEMWIMSQIVDDQIKTPEQSAMENDAVTMEQIKQCAKLLSLDTIYKLSSPKEVK